jgi:hypothetical protein
MWITSPLSIAFAQTFLPAETWVIWFNFVSFVVGVSSDLAQHIDVVTPKTSIPC